MKRQLTENSHPAFLRLIKNTVFLKEGSSERKEIAGKMATTTKTTLILPENKNLFNPRQFFLTAALFCQGIQHFLVILLGKTKDSFINLDQDLLKVVKKSGQVESTVQDKITQKWIQILWLYFLPLKF